MANMSYVRFENTYSDLVDCYEDMLYGKEFDELSESEQHFRNKLIKLCRDISEYFDEDVDEDDE